MRVLLTGFESFGGDLVNSSQETVKAVACDEFEDVDVVTGILPVSFKRVEEAICGLIDEAEPDVMIMLGQSGKSDCIKIERVALNIMDSDKGDNDGYAPDEEPIEAGGAPAYFSNLSVKRFRDVLLKEGIPAIVSNSAGLYVCNRTYYSTLHKIATSKMKTKAVFVHLPCISEEWPVDRLQKSVKIIVENI